jgi:hypothetical protein
MHTLALMLLLTGAPAPPPAGTAVLAGTAEYAALKQPEQHVYGRLRTTPDGFRIYTLDGLGRASNSLDIHAPGKAHVLLPQVERNVRILGKVVAGAGGAKLWPGRIERVGRDSPGADGVIARATLPLGKGWVKVIRTDVIRDADGLATALKVADGVAASKVTAARMSRAAIDWKTQMIVRVDAGLAPYTRQVAVTGVSKEGDKLVVKYARISRKGGTDGGFHNAGEMALVPRHDGPVVFRIEAAK